MKKFLLVLIFPLAMLSCDSDNNDSSDGENPIVGEWQLTSISVNGQNLDINACMLEQTRTFQNNGNLIEYFWEETTPCTYNTSTIQYTFNNDVLVSINGDEIINGMPFEITNNVLTLNASTLIYVETGDNIDGTYPQNQQQTFTYTKI